jgi:DUF1365 family protein
MFNWFRSKETDEDRYATLRKRVADLMLRVDEIEAFQENIRNMSRKIQKNKAKQEEDQEPKSLRDQILMPE